MLPVPRAADIAAVNDTGSARRRVEWGVGGETQEPVVVTRHQNAFCNELLPATLQAVIATWHLLPLRYGPGQGDKLIACLACPCSRSRFGEREQALAICRRCIRGRDR